MKPAAPAPRRPLGRLAECDRLDEVIAQVEEGGSATLILRGEPGIGVPFRHRARLAYGEWLRRERRPVEAHEQPQTAYDAFAVMGGRGFAERARRELLATGGRRQLTDALGSIRFPQPEG
jgi:hypothetical protein